MLAARAVWGMVDGRMLAISHALGERRIRENRPFGRTGREPVEINDLDTGPGGPQPIADESPVMVTGITAIMEEARANSGFDPCWPLPDHRQNQIKMDKLIFDQYQHGIR